MGCFESKPEVETLATEPLKPRAAQPASAAVPTATAQPALAPVPRKKPVITDADRAKHRLKHQRDVLERNVRQSEEVLARDLTLARQLHTEGRTESAKVLLRRRRLVQSRIQLSVAQLDRLEASLGAVEGAESTASVLDAIEEGTAVLKRLNASVNVERAEKVMRESEDAVAYTEEVAAVLAAADDAPADDDEDILAEIATFDKEQAADEPAAPAADAAVEQPPAEAPVEQPAADTPVLPTEPSAEADEKSSDEAPIETKTKSRRTKPVAV